MILKITRIWMAALGIGLFLAPQLRGDDAGVLKSQKDKEAYAIGVDLARNLKRQGIAADADALAKGVRDELSGAKLLMTEEDLRAALNEFQTELKQTRARAVRYVAQENKIKGDAFLAANRAKEGVATLPNGLQYKILKEGEGKKPTEADTVEVNYRGTLLDGTEFDNSYTRGQPATFKVTDMIPGWREALTLMPVGSKWQLFIPPELAYGEKGHAYGKRGSDRRIIGPNATLIFELELLAIK